MMAPVGPEVLEALEGFDTATVSNAIEAFNVRDRTEGYASMELRCQFPDLKPMVGYAVTCTADSTTPGPKRPSNLAQFLDAVANAPRPCVVVVQNVGPDRPRSCFVGDMVAMAYQKLGAVGIVTDGGVRDVSGIRRRAPGLQVFAPGTVVSHGNAVKLEVGVPVRVGGLAVQPGDLLHGDESGLILVPLDIAEAVVEQARRVQEAEVEFFEFLGGPSPSLDEIKMKLTGADISESPGPAR